MRDEAYNKNCSWSKKNINYIHSNDLDHNTQSDQDIRLHVQSLDTLAYIYIITLVP